MRRSGTLPPATRRRSDRGGRGRGTFRDRQRRDARVRGHSAREPWCERVGGLVPTAPVKALA